MKVTAIVNLKGGVAKTTTAINMAWILAHDHGKRVLLIDADSQCNATEFFGVDPEKGNLARLLRFEAHTNACMVQLNDQIQKTQYDRIDMIAGSAELMDLDLSSVKTGGSNPQVIAWLAKAFEQRYDSILIDCPPAFNAASAAALVAADDVIIPIKLDAFSLRGMGNLLRQIENMRAINADLRIAGVLPTMYYPSRENEEAMAVLAENRLRVFHQIRRSPTVDRMTYQQQPLGVCSRKSGAGRDYKYFIGEWMEE